MFLHPFSDLVMSKNKFNILTSYATASKFNFLLVELFTALFSTFFGEPLMEWSYTRFDLVLDGVLMRSMLVILKLRDSLIFISFLDKSIIVPFPWWVIKTGQLKNHNFSQIYYVTLVRWVIFGIKSGLLWI